MENKKVFLIADNEDGEIYRALLFDDGISHKELDKTIERIKNVWLEEDFTGWTIDDLLEELSQIYDFEILNLASVLRV